MPCNCPLAFHFRILTWPSIPDPEGSRSWLGARMQDGSSRRGREGTPSLPAREGRGRQRAGSTSTPAGPTPRVAFGSRHTHWAPAARANAHVPAPRPGSRAARTGKARTQARRVPLVLHSHCALLPCARVPIVIHGSESVSPWPCCYQVAGDAFTESQRWARRGEVPCCRLPVTAAPPPQDTEVDQGACSVRFLLTRRRMRWHATAGLGGVVRDSRTMP